MKKITIANIKGDDHKTYGRIGKSLSLEISKWGGDICGTITTMTSFCNLIVEYEEDCNTKQPG